VLEAGGASPAPTDGDALKRAPEDGRGEPGFSRTLEASVRMPAILNCVRRMGRDIPARMGR